MYEHISTLYKRIGENFNRTCALFDKVEEQRKEIKVLKETIDKLIEFNDKQLQFNNNLMKK